jgi:DNA-binding transcriptional LysR family regulator
MKLDPRHLEILAAIVDCGGLTEGAERLGKSQSSVSRTLAALETRIGAPLFLPGRRPLQPTALGRALARQGREVAAATRQAGSAVEQYRAGRAGVVRLGGTPFFMDGVVSTRIAEFQRVNPDVRLDQKHGYAPDLVRSLSNGTLDLAICPLRPDAVSPGFVFTPVLPGRNVVACAIGHPLSRRKTLEIADVRDFPWIAPPAGSPLYADLKQVLAQLAVTDFKIGFTGGSLGSVLTILAGSDALTVLPYSVVHAQRKAFGITALPVDIDHPDRNLGLLRRAGVEETPVVRRFRAFVTDSFAALDGVLRTAGPPAAQ